MCGIAGFAGRDQSALGLQQVVQRMNDAMARRGPDGEGLHLWPGAALGHRRLAILDLSDAGSQPMLSDDGQIGVVFNGCVYNFLELRAELEALGHRFRSQCDTEVLVRGYQEWGIDALVRRLRGMFAFGVWDNTRRTLTLVRDRLGVKPLLYAVQDGCIGFASTLPALRAAGLVDGIDPQAVLEFLEFGYVTEDRAIFSGAVKLPAASLVEWCEGRISQRTYWTLPEPPEAAPRVAFEEAVEQTEHLLLESVRLRLISDVPVGALLSGGVDSTLICWALSKLNTNIRTFTVSAPGDPADEVAAAAKTARVLGIPHEVVTLPDQPSLLLEDLTAAYGEPFGCSSALAMLQVSRAVKSNATVLLTGDGGDDVFLGYPFYAHYLLAQRVARALPDSAASLWKAARPSAKRLQGLRRMVHFLDYATEGLAAVARAHDGLPYYERGQMLGERLASYQLRHRGMSGSPEAARRLMADFLRYQQRMWFASEFMTKVDGGAMHYALEARSPFLDHKVWEFAGLLPYSVRLRNGTLKAVLREIVRRRVGPQVAQRRKQGFTIPVERWLLSRWRSELDQLAGGSLLEQQGWIRAGSLRPAVARAVDSRRVPRQLWFLVTLEHWLRANLRRPESMASGQAGGGREQPNRMTCR